MFQSMRYLYLFLRMWPPGYWSFLAFTTFRTFLSLLVLRMVKTFVILYNKDTLSILQYTHTSKAWSLRLVALVKVQVLPLFKCEDSIQTSSNRIVITGIKLRLLSRLFWLSWKTYSSLKWPHRSSVTMRRREGYSSLGSLYVWLTKKTSVVSAAIIPYVYF